MPALAKQAPRGDFIDTLFGLSNTISQRFRPTGTIGVGSTAIYGGYPERRETDATLIGREKYITFSNHLANISIVGASVRFFLNLVGGVSWKFEPADESSEAQRLADLTQEIFEDMTTPLHRIVRRTAGARFYGFSIQEWTAKRREEDGVLAFLDVEPRAQKTIERWLVDITGTVHGVVQRSPQTSAEIFIPRPKVVYGIDDSLDDSPEGLGLFRHIVQEARQLIRIRQLEGIGFDTDLRGIPIVRVPSAQLTKIAGLSKEKVAEIERPLREFAINHIRSDTSGLTMDSAVYQTTDGTGRPSTVPLWNVELLKSESTALPDAQTALERLKREIAIVFGTEHLLLGSDSKGSHALSDDKSTNLSMLVDGTLKEIRETYRHDLIRPLFQINGWDEKLAPKLKNDKVQWRDINTVTGALKDMAAAGDTLQPEDEAIPEVYDLLGLTAPDRSQLVEDAAVIRTGNGATEPETEPQPNGEAEPATAAAEA